MKSLIAIVTCLSLFALAEKQGRADYRPYRYESKRMLKVVVVTQTGCWYGSRGRIDYAPFRYRTFSHFSGQPRGISARVQNGEILQVPLESLPEKFVDPANPFLFPTDQMYRRFGSEALLR